MAYIATQGQSPGSDKFNNQCGRNASSSTRSTGTLYSDLNLYVKYVILVAIQGTWATIFVMIQRHTAHAVSS